MKGLVDPAITGFSLASPDFTASYVVKNAPLEGIVINITLPRRVSFRS